jgi:hypothetical protein
VIIRQETAVGYRVQVTGEVTRTKYPVPGTIPNLFTGNPDRWPSHAPDFQRSISTTEPEPPPAPLIDASTAGASARELVEGIPMRFHPLASEVVC